MARTEDSRRGCILTGAWRVGRAFGITFQVHFLFPLILVWAGWSAYAHKQDVGQAVQAVWFVMLLFVVVVLHELGHALAARRYGIATKDITLLPIGGVARLERMPEKPEQELVIALAGPLVNVILILPLAAIVWMTNEPMSLERTLAGEWTVWERLLVANVFLAVFNMIPAFPMDGGRVLRALLAMRLPYAQATNVAAGVGQTFAIFMGVVGLFINPFLLLIAVFVWLGAAGEAARTRLKAALQGVPVRDVMVTEFQTIDAGEPVSSAVASLLNGYQDNFPVMEGGQFVGVLTRKDIVRALSANEGEQPVRGYFTRQTATASLSDDLMEVLARLEECECHIMPVLSGGEMVGLVTPENLGEFLMLNSASEHPLRNHRRVGK